MDVSLAREEDEGSFGVTTKPPGVTINKIFMIKEK